MFPTFMDHRLAGLDDHESHVGSRADLLSNPGCIFSSGTVFFATAALVGGLQALLAGLRRLLVKLVHF